MLHCFFCCSRCDFADTNEDVSTAERQRDQVQAENEDLKKHVGELRQQLQTLQVCKLLAQ